MTMNSSGPISLAGTTAGQSIEIELSGSGTTQISLNDANVRSLAGVASGAITMPTNFYGKSSASYYIAMIQVGTHAGSPSGIVFDGSNNAIIGFGSTTNPNYSQLISLNQTGAINWAIEISNSTNFQINSFWAYCQSLAFDGTYIYATGSYGTAYQSLFKFNTSGTMLANGYISNNAWTSLAIDADSSHNVYIAGQYSYSSGSCALPGSGFSKISLSPATPVETYSYVVTDNGGDYSGVTYDSSGNLHAVGATSSAVYRIYNTIYCA